jgi:hypothetical protein
MCTVGNRVTWSHDAIATAERMCTVAIASRGHMTRLSQQGGCVLRPTGVSVTWSHDAIATAGRMCTVGKHGWNAR